MDSLSHIPKRGRRPTFCMAPGTFLGTVFEVSGSRGTSFQREESAEEEERRRQKIKTAKCVSLGNLQVFGLSSQVLGSRCDSSLVQS